MKHSSKDSFSRNGTPLHTSGRGGQLVRIHPSPETCSLLPHRGALWFGFRMKVTNCSIKRLFSFLFFFFPKDTS